MGKLHGDGRMKKQREICIKPCNTWHCGNSDDYGSGDYECEGAPDTDDGGYDRTGSGSGIADGCGSSGYVGYGQGFETKEGGVLICFSKTESVMKRGVISAFKRIAEVLFLTAIGALMAFAFLGAAGLFDRI